MNHDMRMLCLALAVLTLAMVGCEESLPTATPTPLNTSTTTLEPTVMADPTVTPHSDATSTSTATPATEPTSTPTPLRTEVPAPMTTPESLLAFTITISSPSLGLPAYYRDEWRHWIDEDGDCQNARHEVLIEESLKSVTFKTDQQCQVLTGEWFGAFTGMGFTEASDLDIDHMVPLANAHKSGAWDWDEDRKREYANSLGYPGHLIAVSSGANRSKGAKGPEDWRPPDESYWCEYATDWVGIKSEWELTVTQAEVTALGEMLDKCSERIMLILRNSEVVVPSTPTPLPTEVIATEEPTPTEELDALALYDDNGNGRITCAEARRHGIAPVHIGHPAYKYMDDRDDDGVVCE